MKTCIWLLIFSLVALTVVNDQVASYAGVQQQPPRQPAPGKKFVQTPFGLDEVDLSDPRPAIAVGPTTQPVAPPATPAAAGPAAAQPAPATAQTQPDQDVPVLLNFDNFDIHQVIRTVANVLGLNFIVDPTVRGTVNIGMTANVRRSELLGIFEAILKMNGATMVKAGSFYQIVPANTAVRLPIEIQRAQPAVAPDDQIVLQVVPLKFVAADEMARLLAPYMSDGAGNIVAQGGVLLITDRRSNLRKLFEIIDEFDSRAFQGERVRLLQVKNNRVKDILDDLKTVFSGYALSNNTAIRFLPIERMNSILVVTPNAEVFPEVERWLNRLDQALETAGLRNYVYKAKNAKAVDIQKVLTELYREQFTTTPTGQQQPTPPIPVPIQPQAGGAIAPNDTAGGAISTARLAGQLRIVADTINNALVIQATPQDYDAILRTIEQLDVLPRQVLIDAQVYEVSLDHSFSLGLSAVLRSKGTLNPAQTTASFTGAGLQATTFAFIGRARELVAFLNATENRGRVRTLSAPSILVSNNTTAQVNIGAEVPIPTSSAASSAQQNGSTLFAQTISFRDTGVILSVTPQINEGGNVTLAISQEVSQASANTTSALNAPVIGKSSVRSTILVQDGETIPLTGFIRDGETLSRNRVPLLGSIPGAGVLFGNTTKSNTRSELIILITPHVITTVDERAAAAEELKNKLKETKRLID
jgi:general secretion pathway protein D